MNAAGRQFFSMSFFCGGGAKYEVFVILEKYYDEKRKYKGEEVVKTGKRENFPCTIGKNVIF